MTEDNSSDCFQAGDPASPGRAGHLLIVEPESLLRWSLATYLSKWFDVFPTDTPEAAGRVLDDHVVDAVVVSDQIPVDLVDELEARTRQCNTSVRVVRTVTSLLRDGMTTQGAYCIEKPFDLARLARMLGIDAGSSPMSTHGPAGSERST